MQAYLHTSLVHFVQVLSTDRTQTRVNNDELHRVQDSGLVFLVAPCDLHSCALHGSAAICIIFRCLVAACVPLHLNLANCHTSPPDRHQKPPHLQTSAAVCTALSLLTQQQDTGLLCTFHAVAVTSPSKSASMSHSCCACLQRMRCILHIPCPANLHHRCVACLQALIPIQQQQQDRCILHFPCSAELYHRCVTCMQALIALQQQQQDRCLLHFPCPASYTTGALLHACRL